MDIKTNTFAGYSNEVVTFARTLSTEFQSSHISSLENATGTKSKENTRKGISWKKHSSKTTAPTG